MKNAVLVWILAFAVVSSVVAVTPPTTVSACPSIVNDSVSPATSFFDYMRSLFGARRK